MLQEDFLEKRKNMQFEIKDVQNIVEQLGYKHMLVNTHCTGPGKWKSEAVQAFRKELADLELTYLVYVKFYKINKIQYALVAGKTNARNDDIMFEYGDRLEKPEDVVYESKDKAKKWLATKDGATWDCEEVLIIFCDELVGEMPEKGDEKKKRLENLAYSIEADIGGLLGLFNS